MPETKETSAALSAQLACGNGEIDQLRSLCARLAEERDALSAGKAKLEVIVQQVGLILKQKDVELTSMRSSRSWKLTRPLRAVATVLRREIGLGEVARLAKRELAAATNRKIAARAGQARPAARAASVSLKKLDRSNWRAMLRLEATSDQARFVSTPARSMAGCLAKIYGDEYDYRPMVIYDLDRVVGYATIVCDPRSDSDYLFDDLMIDRTEQGKGYGRAAMREVICLILRDYPHCRSIRLTCHRANTAAVALHLTLGFRPNGRINEMLGEPIYTLSNAELDRYR
jgi:diamine N-acetyltransferase